MKFFAVAMAVMGVASAGLIDMESYGAGSISAGAASLSSSASVGGYSDGAPSSGGYGQPQAETQCTPYFDVVAVSLF